MKSLVGWCRKNWIQDFKPLFLDKYPNRRWGDLMQFETELYQIGKDFSGKEEYSALSNSILKGLELWIKSTDWEDGDGKYIPNSFKFIRDMKWKSTPRNEPGGNGSKPKRSTNEFEGRPYKLVLDDIGPEEPNHGY